MEKRLDFQETVAALHSLSTKAQCTFLYLLIAGLNPMVLRTIMRYCCKRLDQINEELPDTHPYKQQYLERGRRSQRGRYLENTQTGRVHDAWNPDLESYKGEEVDRW